MDRTRIAKVDNVTLARRGQQTVGTLHLTPHHIIFVHTPSTSTSTSTTTTTGTATSTPRELWITYPIISFCTLRTSSPASRLPSSIRLRGRDFTFVCFYLTDDRTARDVYDNIRSWTCKLGRIDKLYAFSYQPQPPERDLQPSGWAVYDPVKEWARMGLPFGSPQQQQQQQQQQQHKTKTSSWRLSSINADYNFSPTYPAQLVVPASISDNTLKYAAAYRSRARIPVLTYLHPVNNCSITRSSQPMVGVRGNRSIQDESLLAAIFSTTRADRPLHPLSEAIDGSDDKAGKADQPDDFNNTDNDSADTINDVNVSDKIYGAQQRNMIIDARPTVNAYVMQAAGLGTENMDNYKFASKAYLGIDNIHVMRDSLQKVVDALKDSDLSPIGPSKDALHKSHWLKHVANMLDGVGLIARQVALQHSHVLIHCSDGWDRTSQLSALSQICLDPYYRTIDGFMVLVEKDWLSFGHMFGHRTGFLSSDKWFQTENERNGSTPRGEQQTGSSRDEPTDAISGAQRKFENALMSAKGFFTKQNDSRESVANADDVDWPSAGMTSSPASASASAKAQDKAQEKGQEKTTKVKETAPIFHQFLDATYQLMCQHPTRFEFSERFLRRLLYHLYSCQYGTFLFNSERERKEAGLVDRTRSVWDYFLARKSDFLNPDYDPVVDDKVRGKERLILPRTGGDEVRWWYQLFGRTDEEMNGPRPTFPSGNATSTNGPLLTTETDAESSFSQPGSRTRKPRPMPTLSNGLSDLSVSASADASDLSDAEMEEMGNKATIPNTSDEKASTIGNPSTSTSTSVRASASNRSDAHAITTTNDNDHTHTHDHANDTTTTTTNTIDDHNDDTTTDIDPLGIGPVKDHVPSTSNPGTTSSSAAAAVVARQKRREHMRVLLDE